MYYDIPEEPGIARVQAVGDPAEDVAGICTACGQPIYRGEVWGRCDGRWVCADCLEAEWERLTPGEKFERLGYTVC